ncbi:MAG: U32 family peptidase [Lachnospiraceae bacterium]|nr:U32 family peptidase [Lachnospiraceae bacterium]
MRAELLSPAGDMDCLKAALNAGADAVYLSGVKYGARAYAGNFTDEELREALGRAHFFGRKIYLTVNTLLKDPETEELYDYLYPLYEDGLDGVIVQDMGVIRLIGDMFPGLPLHASTQMSVTDTEGVRFLESFNVKRVVLARELSLNEIARIHRDTDTELECFIHGALCYSYSGKCLMSSFIGGRSGNRGRCAQPCRLPYPEKYLLSARDICTLALLPKLTEAGIASYKIEGRMKSKEYVGSVTGIYRKHMDMLYENGQEAYDVRKEDFDKLINLYTRSGNSEGYYLKKNSRDMITIKKPSYETTDDELSKKTYETYALSASRHAICGQVFLKENEESRLTVFLKDDENMRVTVTGDRAETAVKEPLGKEDIIKQIKKTADTGFIFDTIETEVSGRVFMRNSSLNALRRSALSALRDLILSRYLRDPDKEGVKNKKDSGPFTGAGQVSDQYGDDNGDKRLHVMLLKDLSIEGLIRDERIGTVSISHFALINSTEKAEKKTEEKNEEAFKTAMKLAERIKGFEKKFFIILPSVLRKEFFKRYPYIGELLKKGIADGVVCDCYEALGYLRDISFKGTVIADLHLYAYSREALRAFCESGLNIITTAPAELNGRELRARGVKGEEMTVYGYLPMMLSAQCLKNTEKKCDGVPSVTLLNDRYHHPFKCVNECSECLNTIYNYVPVFLEEKDLKLVEELMIRPRILFLDEDEEQRKKILDYYGEAWGHRKGTVMIKPVQEYTKGHFNRGIL